MKTTDKGFTIIEVLIVIVIIGVVSAVAIPNLISWVPEYRLRGASRDLYDNMQFARMSAIKAREDCYISFNTPSENQYSINTETETLKTVVLADYGSGITFSSAPETIRFQSNGLSDAENNVEITNSAATYQASVFISGSIKLDKM